MVSRWILCCCLLMLPLTPALAQFRAEASIDRNPVAKGETFVLEVVADTELDREALDSAPLHRQFMVGQINFSSQTRIVNFNASRQTRWRIPLVAKKTGNITLPALTVAGQQTRAIALRVLNHNQTDQSRRQDAMLKVIASKQRLYPGEQLLLTVELYLGVDLQQGNLTPPTLAQAEIRQIGKDEDQFRVVDGRRLRVITRRYSATIEQPGHYLIEGPVFQGEVIAPDNRDLFSQTTIPLLQGSDALAIEVLPVPAGYQGHWLPAETASLDQEWQPQPEHWRVGEPITRTITLTAEGVGKATLPQLSLDYPPGMRVYPEQQGSSEYVQANKLIAQLKLQQAVIPSQEGKLTLPELRVPWWDVVSGQQRWAVLPGQTFEVAAAARPAIPLVPVSAGNSATSATGISPWWLLPPCAGWLLTVACWGWGQRRRNRTAVRDSTSGAGAGWKELLQACQRQQPPAVYRLFCQWIRSPQAARLDPGQLQQLKRQLELHCFDPAAPAWNGSAFKAQLLSLTCQPRQSDQPASALPDLNP